MKERLASRESAISTYAQEAILHHVVISEDFDLLSPLPRSKVAAHVDESKWRGLLAREVCQSVNSRHGPIPRYFDRVFPLQRFELHWCHCYGPRSELDHIKGWINNSLPIGASSGTAAYQIQASTL